MTWRSRRASRHLEFRFQPFLHRGFVQLHADPGRVGNGHAAFRIQLYGVAQFGELLVLVVGEFLDQEVQKQYETEITLSKIINSFTIMAILISCLGLFGLASFVAEQRKKEIGVRKVLGASVFNLWQMLSKEFALLVSISCLIAIPLAWYYLNNWLQQYDYRTNISLWVFLISGIGALLITLLTVSFQAIKAAIANPVKSLRTE